MELKDFDWELVDFTVDEINIKVKFSDPDFISYDKQDTLIVTFLNTGKYLIPETGEFAVVPNGYQVTVALPVQQDVTSESAAKSVEEQLTLIIVANFLMTLVFNFSMQELLGMINTL